MKLDVTQINASLEKIKAYTDIGPDERTEILDVFFEFQQQLESAFEFLNEIPDVIVEDDAPDISAKIEEVDKRLERLENK